MDIFVARQPIFDQYQKVIGYEILHRSGPDNHFIKTSEYGVDETEEVIMNSFLVIGLQTLTRGKRAFINFPMQSLIKQAPTLLPNNTVVIEVLSDYLVDGEVIEALEHLKGKGYILALDDFVFRPDMIPILDLMDIVKVCFLSHNSKERKDIAKLMRYKDARLLAEKIETMEDFEEAKELGYTYFQGHFFARPLLLKGKDIEAFNPTLLELLKEVNQKEIHYEKLESLIKRDVSLSYKLLRYINSLSFGLMSEVHSIRHAISYLGQNGLKKWLSIMSLRRFGKGKANELFVSAVCRASFCEAMATQVNLDNKRGDLFLVGLFSHLDAFLDQPMNKIIEQLPVSKEVKDALAGESGVMKDVYDLVVHYEKGNWELFSKQARKLQLREDKVAKEYFHCLREADVIFGIME